MNKKHQRTSCDIHASGYNYANLAEAGTLAIKKLVKDRQLASPMNEISAHAQGSR